MFGKDSASTKKMFFEKNLNLQTLQETDEIDKKYSDALVSDVVAMNGCDVVRQSSILWLLSLIVSAKSRRTRGATHYAAMMDIPTCGHTLQHYPSNVLFI